MSADTSTDAVERAAAALFSSRMAVDGPGYGALVYACETASDTLRALAAEHDAMREVLSRIANADDHVPAADLRTIARFALKGGAQ